MALNQLFDLGMSDESIVQTLDGPAFKSHSKLDQAKRGEIFDATARQEEQNHMAELHGAEIDMVAQWAKAVAESQNIKLEMESRLLT